MPHPGVWVVWLQYYPNNDLLHHSLWPASLYKYRRVTETTRGPPFYGSTYAVIGDPPESPMTIMANAMYLTPYKDMILAAGQTC